MGHARSLSKLENDLEIVNLAHEISDKKLSVRETEDIINNKDMPKKLLLRNMKCMLISILIYKVL